MSSGPPAGVEVAPGCEDRVPVAVDIALSETCSRLRDELHRTLGAGAAGAPDAPEPGLDEMDDDDVGVDRSFGLPPDYGPA